ncbi:hypothetical protein TPA0905_45880 [Streptomyces olivaceus]|nr:hypothetical protein TPA0905_45880 [Streptomyces olivaceus]
MARSAPTRQPSLLCATLRTDSGGGPSVVRALERRQRSRVLRLTRKAADVPDTARPARSPRTTYTEEAAP